MKFNHLVTVLLKPLANELVLDPCITGVLLLKAILALYNYILISIGTAGPSLVQ